ncbi:MAG: acyl-CoA dehydrogenase family protein [Burkholderiaceae bacterium]|nr:acyl-CoA dehydrogenase family protein [Burkholderiaceae bacterium]
MRLGFTAEEERFRIEVRDFIGNHLPPDIRRKVELGQYLAKHDYVRWQDILAARGWYAVNWPKQWGGPGWTPAQRYLFQQEYGAQPCPPLVQFGVNMVGPVIYTYGNAAQQRRFLPRILANQDWWCQGYSEPGAGSDLASLKTEAVLRGDHYVVNGQKIWTTWAQWADWMFALVRTSREERPQQGISFLLVDMRSPGITVRPIRTFDGDREVNEVFFDDVRVPAEQLVGREGAGWSYGKFLLEHERFVISGLPRSKRLLRRVKGLAARMEEGPGRRVADLPDVALRFADLETQIAALEYTELRYLSALEQGGTPGALVSILKVRGTEIEQAIAELAFRCFGTRAIPFDVETLEGRGSDGDALAPEFGAAVGPLYFNLRKVSIWGGSNEIQRNILARQVLGL